jgi:hypothetical protein
VLPATRTEARQFKRETYITKDDGSDLAVTRSAMLPSLARMKPGTVRIWTTVISATVWQVDDPTMPTICIGR